MYKFSKPEFSKNLKNTVLAAGLAVAMVVGVQSKPAEAAHPVAFVAGALIGGLLLGHAVAGGLGPHHNGMKRYKAKHRFIKNTHIRHAYFYPHYAGIHHKKYKKYKKRHRPHH